jgi:hypothetical protein
MYRYWARFWEGTSKNGGPSTPSAAQYRRLAWKAYYDSLSAILRRNLAYEPEAAPSTSEKPPIHSQSSIRLRQRAELKRVETVYETLLIKESLFPKANETNREIEAWVDSVVDNWRLLCGPTWADADLGEGGKEGVGRSVLDVSALLVLTLGTLTHPDTLPRSHQDIPLHSDPPLPVRRACIAS